MQTLRFPRIDAANLERTPCMHSTMVVLELEHTSDASSELSFIIEDLQYGKSDHSRSYRGACLWLPVMLLESLSKGRYSIAIVNVLPVACAVCLYGFPRLWHLRQRRDVSPAICSDLGGGPRWAAPPSYPSCTTLGCVSLRKDAEGRLSSRYRMRRQQ